MARAAALLLLLSLLLSAGCLGAPRLDFVDAALTHATHDGTQWHVALRGRVVNHAAEEVRRVVLVAGVGPDCLKEVPLPGYVEVGHLAGGASTNVRDVFEQEAPRHPSPTLWWRLKAGEGGAPQAKGCFALATG